MRIVLYPLFSRHFALRMFPELTLQYHSKKERVTLMEMETVKLSAIVMRWYPDMMPFLKQDELNSVIVLRDGLSILEPADAMDIIHYSICEHQNSAYLQ